MSIEGKELQRAWDEELVHAWTKFHTSLGLAYSFAKRVRPIMEKLGDPRRLTQWIATLGLKRCPWQIVDGEITHFGWKMQIRGYVDQHSRQLTNFLLNSSVKNTEIINNIDNFKWSDKRIVDKTRQRESQNESLRRRTTKVVRMRSLCKKHDWNTVK